MSNGLESDHVTVLCVPNELESGHGAPPRAVGRRRALDTETDLVRGSLFYLRIWQRELPHEFFTVTSMTQSCVNFRFQILNIYIISPGLGRAPRRGTQKTRHDTAKRRVEVAESIGRHTQTGLVRGK